MVFRDQRRRALREPVPERFSDVRTNAGRCFPAAPRVVRDTAFLEQQSGPGHQALRLGELFRNGSGVSVPLEVDAALPSVFSQRATRQVSGPAVLPASDFLRRAYGVLVCDYPLASCSPDVSAPPAPASRRFISP